MRRRARRRNDGAGRRARARPTSSASPVPRPDGPRQLPDRRDPDGHRRSSAHAATGVVAAHACAGRVLRLGHVFLHPTPARRADGQLRPVLVPNLECAAFNHLVPVPVAELVERLGLVPVDLESHSGKPTGGGTSVSIRRGHRSRAPNGGGQGRDTTASVSGRHLGFRRVRRHERQPPLL